MGLNLKRKLMRSGQAFRVAMVDHRRLQQYLWLEQTPDENGPLKRELKTNHTF